MTDRVRELISEIEELRKLYQDQNAELLRLEVTLKNYESKLVQLYLALKGVTETMFKIESDK